MRETYIVTGASRGIGKYLADYYESKDKTVIRASRSHGFDVSSFADCQTLCSMPERIDVLINCAGIASMNAAILSKPETVRKIILTNVIGTHNMCACAFPIMRKTKGRIINFSSIAASDHIAGEAIYGASKAGIEKLTKVLAKEFGHWGITVNCIAPNPIETDLIKGVPKYKLDRIIEAQAIERYGKMEDVANICDFFIRPESDMVTGQVIRMGGP